ncbi:hypothetical protein [Bacillus sp. FJAT-22090]|uniref:hypothetical protein n=1 Tax=Bacillus sp. FJAT-22090 TaxID=1581038 RepID=UPI00119D30DD|nr:hypothetical protein [Bacillus sp. FJAT-22090]
MKTIVQDVAEVLVTNLDTGKVVMIGEAQITGISQQINEEKIKGGIGNKTIFLLRSDKEIDLNITSATFDAEFFAMSQGVSIDEAGKAIVTKSVNVKLVDNAGNLEATIPNAPTGLTTAVFVDKDDSQEQVAVATGVATIPALSAAKAGDTVQILYKEEITGRSIELNSSKFASKFRVEYRTISYDVTDATVHADIYYIFEECIPSGAFDMSLQNGQVYTPEINFSVTNPIGSDVMGQYIEKVRE